jgi:hypothetical protein
MNLGPSGDVWRLVGAGVARLGDWGVVRQADDRSQFSADVFLHFPSNGVRAAQSARNEAHATGTQSINKKGFAPVRLGS